MSFAHSLAMLALEDFRPPGAVLEAASTHVTDTLACIVGAHADPLFRARAAVLAEFDQGAVSEGLRLAFEGGPGAAAQWLALAAHWLQYDDGEASSGCHPGCCVVPAAFALACSLDRTWPEFLDAVWRGYAVSIAVGRLLNGTPGPRAFHRTPIAGVFAAAIAAAFLHRRGDVGYIESVLGLAASYACGVLPAYDDPADAEALHPALAARGGVLAARLVASGTRGRVDAFDGPRGLLAALGVDEAKRDKGTVQADAILDCYLKPHATVRHAHGPIEIVQALARQVPWRDMDEIVVEVPQPVLAFAGTIPRSARGAALSMEYTIAAAARWPEDPVADYAFSTESRREVIDSGLFQRVTIRHQSSFDGQAPRRPCRVIVKSGGRLLEGQCEDALGDPGRPLQGRAFEKKVKTLVGAAISADEAERLLQTIANAGRPRRIALLLDAAIKGKEGR